MLIVAGPFRAPPYQEPMMKINGYDISRRSRSVGPEHDPYHREVLTVTNAAGARAVWEICGLMGTTMRLYSAPHVLVREEKEHESSIVKMKLLFKLHVGITPEQATDMLENDERLMDRAMRKEYGFDSQDVRDMERAAGWDSGD
jgi:hypothetical protein